MYVDDRMGKVPIFGYPIMCYSPNKSLNDIAMQKKNVQYDEKKHSKWQRLGKDIFDSTKVGHQLLIRDLLDSHDTL